MTDFVVDANLSLAWGRAIYPMLLKRGGCDELAPLCVSVTGFDDDGRAIEDTNVRGLLDNALARAKRQSCHTVANTIFPESMWNPAAPRALLFERYARSVERMKNAATKNRHGMYFERLVAGGAASHPNQLEFALAAYTARKGVRRSALQLAVFNAERDQTKAAMRGFPCLQHVTFAPVGESLNVNAFYATQYAFERAYGNYLGLCRLGRFVAHELHLRLARVTCFTGIMLRDIIASNAKQALLNAIDKSLEVREEKMT